MKVVLSGSGMRYPAFVGVLRALEAYNLSPTRIAGTSGGAIVAAAYASGYGFTKDKNLADLVLSTLPLENNLLDTNWWPFSKPYGLYKGNKILSKFRDIFPDNIGHTRIPLSIVTCNLETKQPVVWDSISGGEQELAVLVRASMSIPFVFDYVKINKQIHVDGGIANNFPIDLYGSGSDVIGVKIVSKNPKKQSISGLSDYSLAILDTMLTAHENEHIEDALFANTIFIQTDVSSLDFKLSRKQAQELMTDAYAQSHKQLRIIEARNNKR